jgi:hypothetical protein
MSKLVGQIGNLTGQNIILPYKNKAAQLDSIEALRHE